MNKNKLFIIVGSIMVVITVIFTFLLINNKEPITYNISFETNGGSLIESQVVNEGEQVKKPIDPIKDGYMFVEWTYQGNTYDFSLAVTLDLILTAKWIKLEENVKTFVVKFETDGGTTISNQIVEKGNKVEKPSDPVKDGFTFNGWMLNDEIYDFEKIVEENIILKAKWEEIKETNNNTPNNNNNSNNNDDNTPAPPIKNKYTVTFNSNGGSSVASQTVEEGGKVTQPGIPTRSGHTFAGWTLNGSAYNFNTAVTGNITLVAKWTENVKNKYIVTFNSNGGSSVASQTVEEGNKASKPSDPTRTGYTFGGWTLNGSNYDFNSVVTGNITLVAKWVQKSYTVGVARVDAYSPDSILSVFEEGQQITVQSIKYSDGTYLCSGTNTTVNTGDIAGETSFIVVLSDGTHVRATLK